jgi:predicted nucleic acid-binding protein
MTLVIDASVALKWFVDEAGSADAQALLAARDLLIAPELVIAEVCNAGWRAVRAGMMLPQQHDHSALRLAAAFDELVPLAPLAARAAAISRLLDHPAYDCFYLALSEQRGDSLITADRRLLQRVSGTEWGARTVPLGA